MTVRAGAGYTSRDIIVSNLAGDTLRELVATSGEDTRPAASPDGRWGAFTSDVTGTEEVYVVPASGGALEIVSSGGGTYARWSADGSELFYRSGNTIMAVPIRTSPALSIGTPVALFSGSYLFNQGWDVLRDGQFIMIKGDPAIGRRLRVVLNWFDELPETEN